MDAWESYKKHRNIFLIALFSYLPVIYLAKYLNVRVFRTNWLVITLSLAWMIGVLATWIRLSQWRCPRCGKWFTAKWWYNKGFLARKCVHCGLPKYAAHP